MGTLTPRQAEALRCIRDFIESRGYSPTLDEIADELGVTKSTVQQYLAALEERDVIRRERYSHRSIEITDPKYAPRQRTELPLRGRIAAGEPIDPAELPETVDVTDVLELDPDKELFVLQASGESMIGEGILDGDYVVIEKQSTARNGQTVVALLPDHTTTLKKFYREKDRIRLEPANPEMEPIYVDDVTIQGVVRAVIRSYRADGL